VSLLAMASKHSTNISNRQKTPGATQAAPGFCCQQPADVVDPPSAVELDI
jgi:hypothetical protein